LLSRCQLPSETDPLPLTQKLRNADKKGSGLKKKKEKRKKKKQKTKETNNVYKTGIKTNDR